jgi:hypothetical protein
MVNRGRVSALRVPLSDLTILVSQLFLASS